jgi:hypothetical protein
MLRFLIAATLALALVSPSHAGNGRPPQCAGIKWCGCWLAHFLGISDPALNKASNWAKRGRRQPGPCVGCIAVWPHHVGIVRAIPGPGRIVLLSGNDGKAVRERERSSDGVIAWVQL